MKQNGVVFKPGPALLLFLFLFEYLISGPKSYRAFRETGPRELPTYPFLKLTLTLTSHLGQNVGLGEG